MATQKIRLMVDGLTEDTTPDINADYLMTNDASASLQKKVKPANIVGTVLAALRSAFTPASASSAASLALAEDTDNGTNKVTITAPAAIASDKTQTLQDATDTFVYRDTTDTLTNKTLSGATLSGVIDAGGATSFEIPNDAAPTVNADGEIALDTSVADFSHGIPKIYGGEELAFVVLPIAELTTPTDGHVIAYNATNDEFELIAAPGGGIGGSTGATDNAILRANGTGGSTVQNSSAVVTDDGYIGIGHDGGASSPSIFLNANTNCGIGTWFGSGITLILNGVQTVGTHETNNSGYDWDLRSDGNLKWNSSTLFSGADLALNRAAANILGVTNGSTGGGAVQMTEMTAPAAPAANNVRIYAQDNGAGKTQLMALFGSGAAQQIAIEP